MSFIRNVAEKLEGLPTLSEGHMDDLKFDDGKRRVWLSRMTAEDYNDDERAFENELVTIEENKGGSWKPGPKGARAATIAQRLIGGGGPESSQLTEQVKKARVEVLPHSQTGRGAYTKVTLSNGHTETFAGRLTKREAVSSALDAWQGAMLQRSHVTRPALPPGTTRG
jgi:hypothetical protein